MCLLPTNLNNKTDQQNQTVIKNDNEVFLFCDDSHRSGGMHSDTATDAKKPSRVK